MSTQQPRSTKTNPSGHQPVASGPLVRRRISFFDQDQIRGPIIILAFCGLILAGLISGVIQAIAEGPNPKPDYVALVQPMFAGCTAIVLVIAFLTIIMLIVNIARGVN